jgi:hypothetical protein
MIVGMRKVLTRRSKRRNRRTRKGGDNKIHYRKLNISNQRQMNNLFLSYEAHLLLERDRVMNSYNSKAIKYKKELQQLIDIIQNEKIPHERKQAIAVMAYYKGQTEKEESELQKLLNPMRTQQLKKLKKLEEKTEQTPKNRESGKTNSTNFTDNNWTTFESAFNTMPERKRR